jgi:chromosome segregation ATPase
MADKNYVVSLNVDASGAVTNLNQVEKEITETTEKTLGLKQQLRALQLEMQNLDPSDARFQELSKQAGELKDTILDTAEAIIVNGLFWCWC